MNKSQPRRQNPGAGGNGGSAGGVSLGIGHEIPPGRAWHLEGSVVLLGQASLDQRSQFPALLVTQAGHSDAGATSFQQAAFFWVEPSPPLLEMNVHLVGEVLA